MKEIFFWNNLDFLDYFGIYILYFKLLVSIQPTVHRWQQQFDALFKT
jgi:hypothetical protein